MTAFEKAVKKRALLRSALFGPAGSGKTYTSLLIAKGMLRRMKELDPGFTGSIGLIDSERRTSELYADRFDFTICDLEDNLGIDDYLTAIDMAAQAGINPLIVDSGTHPWQELLAEVDKLAYTKYRGNSFQAWSEGTPKQKKLVRAIQSYPGHLIWTMRSKTEWLVEKDERTGKTKPVRVGLSPEQGKGIEYEFSLLLELSPEHFCNVIKDRTGRFQDNIIDKPGEEFGVQLIDWLNSGAAVTPPPKQEAPKQQNPQKSPNGSKPAGVTKTQLKTISDLCIPYFLSPQEILDTCITIIRRTVDKSSDLTFEEAEKCIAILSDENEAVKYHATISPA